jgi:hypothetical protein
MIALAAHPLVPAPITEPSVLDAHFRQILQQPEFQRPEQADLWERLSEWLIAVFQSLQESFNQFRYARELGNFSTFVMWLVLMLAILAFFYWGFRIWHARRAFFDLPRPQPTGSRFFEAPEIYEPRLDHAVQQRQWNKALRLAWLRFLSLLERREWVFADRTRTNWEYLQQLKQRPDAAPALALLQRLALRYDHHVYGGAPAENGDWTEFSQGLEQAQALLRLAPRPLSPSP